ncbi:MAG: thioredoxin family protein [Undibacterium sp.]|uniref:thioredoxin family protein n=1 Tax=Undibacterium sp. TaxID=1914977 RepID=UPI002720A805|nr:thioredoxin family protein [Undibacterium sp.]MDO8654601.1 thioredoxin family protein [Undibacterium sp.]
MKFIVRLAIMAFFGFVTLAHAGIFDDINRAMEAAKSVTAMVPGSVIPTSQAQAGNQAATVSGASALYLPFDLNAYPRSQQYRRIDNPLERISIPLSTPQKTPDGYIARYSVPMEGKVTMLQFIHRRDDSPLLIKQYYEAWLAQAGFERMLVCEAPCSQLSSKYNWRQAVDPSERLDTNTMPDEATYIAAYKADAMVLVGIGKRSDEYASLVKVVEGRVLDAQAWKILNTARPAAPSVTPSRPPAQLASAAVTASALRPQHNGTAILPISGQIGTAAATLPAAADDAFDGVEMIAASDLAARLAASKGFVTVQLSSYDPGCPFCAQANPKFDEMATHNKGKVTFWRVMWQPWASFSQDAFAKAYGVNGLPTTFTFKNGQLVRRSMGNLPVEEQEKQLLRGLR